MNLLLINGPNLNLLGKREPSIYGLETLETIEEALTKKAISHGVTLQSFQSNSEGQIVDRIQQSIANVDAILINAGAYTHTSVAIRDALLGAQIPYVELHLSNTYAREGFRQKSLLADSAIGIICGFGGMSYELALEGALAFLNKNKNKN
ncbi:type II 3-dehydroquinate dehydratase [Prochlorococcus marinus]|uniref:type II 3-dehydroquinate dehydratase n=1 Tax=Prochlorococcus marinus TaxID=1219 RepID=UPI0022B513D3|nr:type II 3-dehydroquinate dehydratase [Prochlorococcus marinus]